MGRRSKKNTTLKYVVPIKALVALPVLGIICLLTLSSITDAQAKSNLFLFLPAIVSHSSTPPGIGVLPPPGIGAPPKGNGQYTIIAWNELGMH